MDTTSKEAEEKEFNDAATEALLSLSAAAAAAESSRIEENSKPHSPPSDTYSHFTDKRRGIYRVDRHVAKWTEKEDEDLRRAVEKMGGKNWKLVAELVPGRDHTQCLQRWTKCLKPGLKKGPWSVEEDEKLVALVQVEIDRLRQSAHFDELNLVNRIPWAEIYPKIEGRTSKQCRERYEFEVCGLKISHIEFKDGRVI